MAHFVNTIHNYIMVEVVESQWKVFQDDMSKVVEEGDLD